nr:response regulator transcription factor [Curtobacterium sp. VKM Ac-2852]
MFGRCRDRGRCGRRRGRPLVTIRVLVVDDQAIVRDGLVTVLSLVPDLQVVGQAADGGEAIAAVDRYVPDVVLMDLRMPGVDGPTATARIVAEHPGVAVLVLTTYADDDSIVTALRAGARGYLTKDAGRAEIATAVRAVAAGQSTFDATVGARLVARLASVAGADAGAAAGSAAGSAAPAGADPGRSLGARFPDLTPRELDVLERIADGRTNPQIAAELFLTVPTVKSYVNQVFAKLGVRTRAEAVTRVLR